MADISYSKPYAGGFRNKPDTSTPFTAAVGNNFQDGIAAATTQANLALSTALGGGPATGVTISDNGDDTLTIHVAAGSPVTVVDGGDHFTFTI